MVLYEMLTGKRLFTGSRNDICVRPFPRPGGKWRISTGGGVFPHWSATAHELLFVSQGKVKIAPVGK